LEKRMRRGRRTADEYHVGVVSLGSGVELPRKHFQNAAHAEWPDRIAQADPEGAEFGTLIEE